VLLGTLDADTTQLVLVGAFLVMGIGIGMVPMVALTAAQNAVPVEDIGAASAAVTFFRSIGAAFGVTVFGAWAQRHLSSPTRQGNSDVTYSCGRPVSQHACVTGSSKSPVVGVDIRVWLRVVFSVSRERTSYRHGR
jgi:hypothetical protein